jgi:(p)ppGpp synthase/HD superfamily hydrolase
VTIEAHRLRCWAAEHGPHAADTVARALDVAREAHRGQFRRSGDPYIVHPVTVALILAEHGAQLTTVIVALLHDLSDTTAVLPEAQLRSGFGDETVDLLVEFTALDATQAYPDAVGDADPRAVQIRIVDRLHNMRTIRFLDVASQRRKADHTLRVVAPLARTFGLIDLGDELEQLANSTLRAHAPSASRGERARSHGGGGTASRNLLRVGPLVLPTSCRDRWLEDWDGELHALGTRHERFSFAVDVLLGLPRMAVLTRRSEL